ncbi:cobalamin biosynthesis protein CbiM [Zavarzinia aquatilis]|uniref:Cobalamin biosynthesis protein CbiM n=2 Tax=Zavarzinia aquatilis TaxID=2211142 RepID=A0A317E8T7_9PROT|nr:cobalamin biosynthesis protein CbiM [Zavarzinia aquatilis]
MPAAAHRLKLFATIEGGTISGYAFFIGGGRPEGATIVIRDAAGTEVHREVTDGEGRFTWTPPAPGSFVVTVDAGDGHAADIRLGEERFGPTVSAPTTTMPTAQALPADTAAIEAAVDRAVARQIRPLLEAYDEAEGRVRFNDIVGGIGMIVGLAGAALWASSRRRGKGGS